MNLDDTCKGVELILCNIAPYSYYTAYSSVPVNLSFVFSDMALVYVSYFKENTLVAEQGSLCFDLMSVTPHPLSQLIFFNSAKPVIRIGVGLNI